MTAHTIAREQQIMPLNISLISFSCVCVLIAHFWAKCRGQILVEKHAGGHDLFIYECICSSAASLNL